MGQVDKKFYWIKLRTDFFQEDSPIDFLMSQENGAQYVVLYQMLCLKTTNTNGHLSSQIGEMIIPYDIKKIVRDTKYFDVDTVTVALELFKNIGLIYQQEDGNLVIADYSHLIGNESASKAAITKRNQRRKQAEALSGHSNNEEMDIYMDEQEDTEVDNDVDTKVDTKVDKMSDRVKSIEYKSIEYKSIENKKINNITSTSVDVCPSFQEEPQQKYVMQEYVDKWNTLEAYGVSKCQRLTADSQRVPMLKKRLREFGEDSFDRVIELIKESDFLLGRTSSPNRNPFNINFGWVIKPENYRKILEGYYKKREKNNNNNSTGSAFDHIDVGE